MAAPEHHGGPGGRGRRRLRRGSARARAVARVPGVAVPDGLAFREVIEDRTLELAHKVKGVNPKQGFRSVVAGGIVLLALGAAQPFPAGLKWDAADCSVDTALHVALARIRSEEG